MLHENPESADECIMEFRFNRLSDRYIHTFVIKSETLALQQLIKKRYMTCMSRLTQVNKDSHADYSYP